MKNLEDQLIQAQKMEAIGTLAGGIAHDFNNILMGIQGRTSLMSHDLGRDHPHHLHLESIQEYIQDASNLTGQLLGFARGGKYQACLTDLNSLIRRQLDLFTRTRKEVVVRTDLDPQIHLIMADRHQMQQVLLNLLVNAWQAMPQGGNILIQTRNVLLDKNHLRKYAVKVGEYIRLTISDTGVGMDETTRQRVFEPFFTTKSMGRGTGMGLASVYGIVKNHDGYIDVDSEPDNGTAFHLYLPAAEARNALQAPAEQEALDGQRNILLVDDEEMIIEVGQQMLQRLGYGVIVASSGESAVEKFRSHRDQIDMVLLDMVMPGMGGEETFSRLKAIKPGIRVLLASGYSIEGQASQIMQRGCDGFIQKPYNLSQLGQKIDEILAARK